MRGEFAVTECMTDRLGDLTSTCVAQVAILSVRAHLDSLQLALR